MYPRTHFKSNILLCKTSTVLLSHWLLWSFTSLQRKMLQFQTKLFKYMSNLKNRNWSISKIVLMWWPHQQISDVKNQLLCFFLQYLSLCFKFLSCFLQIFDGLTLWDSQCAEKKGKFLALSNYMMLNKIEKMPPQLNLRRTLAEGEEE